MDDGQTLCRVANVESNVGSSFDTFGLHQMAGSCFPRLINLSFAQTARTTLIQQTANETRERRCASLVVTCCCHGSPARLARRATALRWNAPLEWVCPGRPRRGQLPTRDPLPFGWRGSRSAAGAVDAPVAAGGGRTSAVASQGGTLRRAGCRDTGSCL